MQTQSSGVRAGKLWFWPSWAGSSTVVSAASALMLVVVGCLAATAWWVYSVKRSAIASARQKEVEVAASSLAERCQALMAAEDLVTVQAQVAAVARQFKLETCRIVLPDGSAVADADPSRVTVHTLPSSWAGQSMPPPRDSVGGDVALHLPVDVAGKGRVRLEVTAPIDFPVSILWQTLLGVGVLGAVSVAGLLFILRFAVRQLTSLSLIRQALLEIQQGEQVHAALAIDNNLGPEAEGWNRLLAETEELRKKSVAQRTADTLAARGQGQAELESACDAMWQGLIVVDRHLHAKYVNGAAAVLLQTKRDEIVGAEINQFIHDEKVLEAVKTSIDSTSFQRRTFEVEREAEGGQGQGGMLRISVRPVRRSDPAAAIVVIEDITQLRTAENTSHAFIAQATHELRTPLTNICLYVETLLESDQDDPKLRANCLNVINQESRRLERIVGDMLSVSEIEAGSFQIKRDDVRLEVLIEDIKADYQAQAAEKQLTISFDLAPKLPVIYGDRDKIMLALQNLVGNAIKYTPTGGQVSVAVEVDPTHVTVDVKDSGIGIDEQEMERVFEKFYRAKDKRVTDVTGSGLGLALARKVVRLHGGDITVESQINKGSSFTLTLPIRAEAA